MKTNGHDILASRPDLKDRPFGVPEGYFESFKKDMAGKAAKPQTSLWKKCIPYMAAAASLALVLSVGSLVKDIFTSGNDFTDEDYILFSNSFISTAEYDNSDSYQFADAELMDEDIVEYLIYLGVSPESIELSK